MVVQGTVRRQHYISEKLLRFFANPSNQLAEALVGIKKVYLTSTSNSMCEKFVYEDTHLSTNTIEKYFGEIESTVVPLVRELVEVISRYQSKEVEFAEIKARVEQLLPAAIVFYYRSGALLAEFSSINKNDRVRLLSHKILNEPYILALAETIRHGYKFAIIESDKKFLISDQYISTAALAIKTRFFNMSNRHIGLRDTLILIPISASYYVAYWHTDNNFILQEDKLNQLSDEEIRLFNKAIINNSYVKTAGQSPDAINSVIADYKWAAPTQIYAGGNPDGYHMGAINKKEVFFSSEDQEAFEMLDFMQFEKYKGMGRNDSCPCGSGKKFKRCHEGAYQKFTILLETFRHKDKSAQLAMLIPGIATVELPIDQWSGYSKKN